MPVANFYAKDCILGAKFDLIGLKGKVRLRPHVHFILF